jgi:peroxiredoxin
MRSLLLGALFCTLALAEPYKVGSKVENFTLTDAAGAPASFDALKGDVTVVMFIATKCPISNDYNDRMKAVYNEFTPKGVKFVFVNPNSNEPSAEVAEHRQTHGFPFAVYKDEGNVVADRFGAQVTPEAFVIDKTGVVRYHGYIDDSRNAERIQNRGLQKALDAVLSGGAVPAPETKAFGCTIKRMKRAS